MTPFKLAWKITQFVFWLTLLLGTLYAIGMGVVIGADTIYGKYEHYQEAKREVKEQAEYCTAQWKQAVIDDKDLATISDHDKKVYLTYVLGSSAKEKKEFADGNLPWGNAAIDNYAEKCFAP